LGGVLASPQLQRLEKEVKAYYERDGRNGDSVWGLVCRIADSSSELIDSAIKRKRQRRLSPSDPGKFSKVLSMLMESSLRDKLNAVYTQLPGPDTIASDDPEEALSEPDDMMDMAPPSPAESQSQQDSAADPPSLEDLCFPPPPADPGYAHRCHFATDVPWVVCRVSDTDASGAACLNAQWMLDISFTASADDLDWIRAAGEVGEWVAMNSHSHGGHRQLQAWIPISARGDDVLNPGAMRALKAGLMQWVADVIMLCHHKGGAGQRGCGDKLRRLVRLAEREGLGNLGLGGGSHLDDIPKTQQLERAERGPRGESLVWRSRRPGTPAPPRGSCVDVGLGCIRREAIDADADEDMGQS